MVIADSDISAQDINDIVRQSEHLYPGIVQVVEDPIVSSDVIGNPHSLIFDTQGTIKAGRSLIKTLSWYENLGHAARMLDVVQLYANLDRSSEAAQ